MFEVVKVDLESDKGNTVFLNIDDAKSLNLGIGDRVEISSGKEKMVGIVALSKRIVKRGQIGIEPAQLEKERFEKKVKVIPLVKPKSVDCIKRRLLGESLKPEHIRHIIFDLMAGKLSDVEAAYFVASSYVQRLSPDEEAALAQAIIDAGNSIKFSRKPILDKHCIGGVPGNRTTPIVVPIIAAAGYTIPKTSSRAITSPAGTADVMEVLADVSFSSKEVKKIVNKVGGCMVWGGAVDLAPADDILLKLRYPLRLDPLAFLLASILAKKKSIGAEKVLIDIPLGAKVKNIEDARNLANRFRSLGKRLKMDVTAIITDGSQPIGHGIGPALEAQDVLRVLQGKGPEDLRNKSIILAGKLLGMAGEENGQKLAEKLLDKGKAYDKFKEIIEAQKGNPDIQPKNIALGKFSIDIKAETSGPIEYDSNTIAKIARVAGNPSIKSAGVYLKALPGKKVKTGQTIMKIYTVSENRVKRINEMLKETSPVVSKEMLIEVI